MRRRYFDEGVKDCPLSYGSHRVHQVRDMLGTWLLSTLDVIVAMLPITALRGDTVSPALLRTDSGSPTGHGTTNPAAFPPQGS